LTGGVFAIRNHITRDVFQTACLIVGYMIGIKLINPGSDLKVLHDVAIMYIFYKLGTLASIDTGNRTLWAVMIIVLAGGLFELLLPTTFGKIFNVWSYYVNKGVIPQDTINYRQSDLFISGNRGSFPARTFFPGIFGSHRVSSIFLEPVSLGNFSVVAFAWCLSASTGKLRNRALLIVFSALCFALADSRFGAICCLILLILRLAFFVRSNFLVFLLPILVLVGLTMTGSLIEMPGNVVPSILNDDFSGRLLFSARLLDYWNLQQWLGLAPSNVYTADTGYAYLINGLGLPLTLCLVFLFAVNGGETADATKMKVMIAAYFAAELCIGAAVFTIKTDALLWFLYGTTNAISRAKIRLLSEEASHESVRSALPIEHYGA
jgi:putative polymerase